MSEPVKQVEKKTVVKKTVVAKVPAVKKTIEKKTPAVKKTNAKTVVKADDKTKTAEAAKDTKPKLTQGQKLLKSMTAQKAARKALMKGVATTHVSFDDEGNEAKVETVIQKTETPAVTRKTNKSRPAVKKPAPKKRKAGEEVGEEEELLLVEEKVEKKVDDNKKPPKKAKKAKKSKIEIEETKKDSKQEEALAYVRTFVNDRDAWKFKKVQQIWLLSNLYEIPEEDFSNVLEYLKDLQGSAREKAKKEAQEKLPQKEEVKSNTLTGYANVAGNDDDFDAEKLLAQASMAPVVVEEEIEDEDETAEIKRAKLIINVLG
ncbi:uncharacterized protein EV154DRAFT_486481 [Mucor mucedo]|uniref:uncharacterized protein n=1 Tax=Mucor mucedo TaxID=29922 RepID=UPI0022205E60|nr:uncharacterized protein EV154DRAFT_486481 [Mucor mucedo]KAI7876477.1 hypothetical protein EV154DRAFT_486481 [Mucor mucedo]